MAVFLADGAAAQLSTSSVDFSTAWDVLGPFQIGTREAPWGADPLEYFGGFRSLERNDSAQFASSLPRNGAVRWSTVSAERPEDGSLGKVGLSLNFTDVDWPSLQLVYGWAAFQYQAWARGEITVSGSSTQNIVLHTDSALEFWVDDVHYFGGDFYTFRNAPPVLRLEPGEHRIDVRIVRDVRAMGGIGLPAIDIGLEMNRTSEGLERAKEAVTVSDVVNGTLASPLASAVLRNSGLQELEVTGVTSPDPGIVIALVSESAIRFAPGQTRPVAIRISDFASNATSLKFSFVYSSVDSTSNASFVHISHDLSFRSLYDPHKVTYLHPGSVVSYFMLRPPQTNMSLPCALERPFPLLLQLHGAGVEAESDQVAHALDPVLNLCAWVLFPTGVTSWSSDDWHAWGWRDVEAAIAAIPVWIDTVNWKGPGANIEKWLVSGHSNGGQGTWYALTHFPDKVIAAAPVSGYLSIPTYVPYQLWFPTDPRKMAISMASVNSYRHELLADNTKGIPILQQHGDADDNVPPWHSRYMHLLLQLSGWKSFYNELPGAPHYYDGMMTTDPLKEFYRTQTENDYVQKNVSFRLVVANPADTGSKYGILVTNLIDPGQLGIVDCRQDSDRKATLLTSNIKCISIEPGRVGMAITVDGQEISGLPKTESTVLERSAEDNWEISLKGPTTSRRGRQLGALDAIMRTNGTFTIRHVGPSTMNLALQISRNLYQYFQADATIISKDDTDAGLPKGNVITIVEGIDLPQDFNDNFPIQISASGDLTISDYDERIWTYRASCIHGAVFLKPLDGEALNLVVWGMDTSSVSQAARLVPTLTGVGQPDFVVLRKECKWRGLDGVAAAGFFDCSWKVSKTSFLS